MYRKRTIAMWYVKPNAEQVQIMNFESGEWMDLEGNADSGHIRYLTLMMSSAIIGKGGSDTGKS